MEHREGRANAEHGEKEVRAPGLAARLNPGRSGSTREDGFVSTEDPRVLNLGRRCGCVRERLVLALREPDLRLAAEL